MNDLVLTKTKLQQGVWEGLLTGAASGILPKIDVTHQGKTVQDVTVTAVEGGHAVQVPVPREAIADGMQTLLITDADTGTQISSVTLMAGEVLDDDLRVEVNLLRAELDMLKRAFRRHCLETS